LSQQHDFPQQSPLFQQQHLSQHRLKHSFQQQSLCLIFSKHEQHLLQQSPHCDFPQQSLP
jgi:hypothetical protein